VGFRRADLMPPSPGENVKCAAFVEINGDGWPDVLNLAVPAGRKYVLTVRFSDGRTGTWPVDLTSASRLTVTADHEGLAPTAPR
jgi:hypothetical protein